MKRSNNFPFDRARQVTRQESRSFKKAIEDKLGTKRRQRGRPQKTADKYKPIAIRLHPKILMWAKREAKRRGVGYQTIINEVLLKIAA